MPVSPMLERIVRSGAVGPCDLAILIGHLTRKGPDNFLPSNNRCAPDLSSFLGIAFAVESQGRSRRHYTTSFECMHGPIQLWELVAKVASSSASPKVRQQ